MGVVIGVGNIAPRFPYEELWYGLKINLKNGGHNIADGKLERVGNLDLHRSLPIQNRIKRYIANADGSVKYLLGENDSRLKKDGSPAKLDAQDGIVQLYKPDYYRKFEFYGDYLLVAISEVELPGFEHMSEKSRSPWLATFNRKTNQPTCACFLKWSGNEPARGAGGILQFTANAADYRGGNNSATNDGKYNSLIGMPQSATNKNTIRTRCQSLGSMWHFGGWRFREEMSWLMAIEFGDLDSQAEYVAEKTADGFAQGGLGNGTFYNGTEWNEFNGYYPFIPAGITAPLGNNTGIVNYKSLQADGSYKTFKVPSYRGWEAPQQYLYEHNDDVLVLSNKAEDWVKLFLCKDSSKFATPADSEPLIPDGYEELGLLPAADGYISSMGVAKGYSFPDSVVGGSSNKNYCDYFYRPKDDGWYQLLSAAIAGLTETAGVRCTTAGNRGTSTSAYYGFPLCLDLAEGI